MKKVSLLLIVSLMVAFFSCSKNEDLATPSSSGEKAKITIKINGISKGLTKAPGIPGPEITDPVLLDSLVKNVRILAFDNDKDTCVAFSDYKIILSKDNLLTMTVPTGVKDFVLVTNVNALMPTTGLVGMRREEMITYLPQDTYYTTDRRFRTQAPHMFYGLIENKEVVTAPTFVDDTQNHYDVSLVRMVSQLETMLDKKLVYDIDGNVQFDKYIVSLDTIILRSVSPDMSLTQIMNNQAPTLDASNTRLTSTIWRAPGIMGNTNAKLTNFLLSFPTEPIGTYPYVIIGATVDSDPTKAPGDLVLAPGETGLVKRYWSVQLKNKHLRENVRLLLDITKLKGAGKNTYPEPVETATCEFNITLLDWDPMPDSESGEGTYQ